MDRPQLLTASRDVKKGPRVTIRKIFLNAKASQQRDLATIVRISVANSICRMIIAEQLSAWTRPFRLSCGPRLDLDLDLVEALIDNAGM